MWIVVVILPSGRNIDFRFLIMGIFGILANGGSKKSIINDENRDFGVDGR